MRHKAGHRVIGAIIIYNALHFFKSRNTLAFDVASFFLELVDQLNVRFQNVLRTFTHFVLLHN